MIHQPQSFSNRAQTLFPWVVAVVLSVAFHIWMVEVNPSLVIGGTLSLPEREAARPPITMDDVQTEELKKELPKLLDRYAQTTSGESEWSIEDQTPELDSGSIEQPEIADSDVAPEQRDPTEIQASLPALEDTWQPAQEILMITETRVEEELAVLPRVLAAPAERVVDAPDLVLPSSLPDLASLEPGPAAFPRTGGVGMSTGLGGGEGLFAANIPMPGTFSGGESEDLPVVTDLEIAPPDEIVALTEEPDQEVSTLEAVEDLLRLETSSYVDPAEPGYRYFQIRIHRAGIERLPVIPREVVLLQDCSESMTSSKLRQCIAGAARVIESLDRSDVFNIITFRDSVQACFPVSQPADIVRKARGKGFLADLKAFGKTDVYASLQAMSQLKPKDNRPVIAILVTDGRPTMGLTDSSEIIEGFTTDNGKRISVFSVGGGKRANKYLLDFLSYRNRGDALVVPRKEEIPDAMAEIARQLQRPVLRELDYRLTSSANLEVYPKTLTDLYLDRPLLLRGRVPVSVERFAIQIEGRSLHDQHDMVFTIDLQDARLGEGTLRREWAWLSILDRIGTYISSNDPQDRKAIETLSERYNILVPYAYSLDAVVPR